MHSFEYDFTEQPKEWLNWHSGHEHAQLAQDTDHSKQVFERSVMVVSNGKNTATSGTTEPETKEILLTLQDPIVFAGL